LNKCDTTARAADAACSDQIAVGPATVQMGNGETYDCECVAGEIRIEVRIGVGDLLVSMKVTVR
jgi:hypothetical protein